jgi:hypothetical protein
MTQAFAAPWRTRRWRCWLIRHPSFFRRWIIWNNKNYL